MDFVSMRGAKVEHSGGYVRLLQRSRGLKDTFAARWIILRCALGRVEHPLSLKYPRHSAAHMAQEYFRTPRQPFSRPHVFALPRTVFLALVVPYSLQVYCAGVRKGPCSVLGGRSNTNFFNRAMNDLHRQPFLVRPS